MNETRPVTEKERKAIERAFANVGPLEVVKAMTKVVCMIDAANMLLAEAASACYPDREMGEAIIAAGKSLEDVRTKAVLRRHDAEGEDGL